MAQRQKTPPSKSITNQQRSVNIKHPHRFHWPRNLDSRSSRYYNWGWRLLFSSSLSFHSNCKATRRLTPSPAKKRRNSHSRTLRKTEVRPHAAKNKPRAVRSGVHANLRVWHRRGPYRGSSEGAAPFSDSPQCERSGSGACIRAVRRGVPRGLRGRWRKWCPRPALAL